MSKPSNPLKTELNLGIKDLLESLELCEQPSTSRSAPSPKGRKGTADPLIEEAIEFHYSCSALFKQGKIALITERTQNVLDSSDTVTSEHLFARIWWNKAQLHDEHMPVSLLLPPFSQCIEEFKSLRSSLSQLAYVTSITLLREMLEHLKSRLKVGSQEHSRTLEMRAALEGQQASGPETPVTTEHVVFQSPEKPSTFVSASKKKVRPRLVRACSLGFAMAGCVLLFPRLLGQREASRRTSIYSRALYPFGNGGVFTTSFGPAPKLPPHRRYRGAHFLNGLLYEFEDKPQIKRAITASVSARLRKSGRSTPIKKSTAIMREEVNTESPVEETLIVPEPDPQRKRFSTGITRQRRGGVRGFYNLLHPSAQSSAQQVVSLRTRAGVYAGISGGEEPTFWLETGDRVLVTRLLGEWAEIRGKSGSRAYVKKRALLLR